MKRRALACARVLARKAATATPERLSLASEGWQAWLEIRISSLDAPGSTYSP